MARRRSSEEISPRIYTQDNGRHLHPTARRILVTAKQLLVSKGLDGVTFEAIAAKARVNKSATRYHFGDKAGLIEALVDELFAPLVPRRVSREPESEDQRIAGVIATIRQMVQTEVAGSGFFDLLPHVVRDKRLRRLFRREYATWLQGTLDELGLSRLGAPCLHEETAALAQFIEAVGDGLSVQAQVFGEDLDPDPVLRLLTDFVTERCEALKQAAKQEGA